MKSRQREMECFYHYKQVWQAFESDPDLDWLLEAEPQILVTEKKAYTSSSAEFPSRNNQHDS